MSYDKNYVDHSDLITGMKMDYTMQAQPNRQRGTTAEAAPYSFSKEYKPAKAKKKK
jgi:putative alpha-1,2-mannosidase